MYKKTIITIILLILVFGSGILVGTRLRPKSTTAVPANQADTYQAGWDAAKKRLAQSGVGFPADMEIKNLNGTVQKISDNSITVQTTANFSDPLSDPSLDTRTVLVDGDTKIFQLVQKDPIQFQKEMADFQKKTQALANSKNAVSQPITPPMMQDKKEASLSDIKEGQMIMVISNDNIRNAAQFTASEIDVTVMPTVAPVTPPAPAGNTAQ